jgi:hypothetical protein
MAGAKVPASIPSDVGAYVLHMEELKRRLALLHRVANGGVSLGPELFNYELLSVQFRKVLEHIAFGSLCANREAYAAVHAEFHKHWNAAWLLDSLREIHPDFYPKAATITPGGEPGSKLVHRLEDGFLTEDEFAELYGVCCDVLHTPNPYAGPKRVNFRLPVKLWLARIERLLNVHYMQPSGTDGMWVVQMQHPHDGKVHAFIASVLPSPDLAASLGAAKPE